MRTKILFLILAASLVTNGVFVYKNFHVQDEQELAQKQYPLLSKRIFVENQNDILINFIPLRQALKEYVGKQEGKVGAYFEYLPSGTSIGVNDKTEVKLASLSKIPMVMSILKKIEHGQLSLNDTIVIKKENLNQEFGTLWKQGEGAKISVKELIRLSLVESDNTAYYALSDKLTSREINEVYQNLDIPLNKREENNEVYPVASPKNYSSIFRSLYLSSFLAQENSNYILDLLTQTSFNNKILAGVPKTVKVAHKIGVFQELDTTKDLFVDCGIIYVPNRPYILCAFVLDTNEQAQKHISYISKMIYEYIIKVKGGQ